MTSLLPRACATEHDTEELGIEMGQHAKAGDVIALYGGLGAGKTCLVHGVAAGMQVLEDERVASPTYALVHEYMTHSGLILCHMDLYRIESMEGIEALGLEDLLGAHDRVCVIEWAERCEKLLPKNTQRIVIETRSDGSRVFKELYHS